MSDSKVKILIAEDEPLVARELKMILEQNGYSVISIADSGKEVLRLSHTLKPDLILMDIMLKGKMSGIDAAEKIGRSQNVPVIFLSSLCDDESFLHAYQTKPYAYITKPFRKNDLLKRIGKVFEEAL